MEDFENNEIRIINYLENRMSPAGEEAFMRELGENDELRRQYEEELLTRALLRETTGDDLLLQPADEHLNMLKTALESRRDIGKNKGSEKKGGAPIRPLYIRYRLAAAILLAIIAGTLIYLFAIRKSSTPSIVTGPDQGKGVGPDSVRTPQVVKGRPDTAHGAPDQAPVNNPSPQVVQAPAPRPAVDAKDSAERLFARLYTPYSGADDPVQVSRFYQYYRQAKYDKLFAATDASVQEMGSDENETLPKAYLHLYKGLGYLADQQPEKALPEFDQVLQKAGPATAPYYQAQWYAALTWLKEQDPDKAAALAREIRQSASPYKTRAGELLEELNYK